MQQLWRRWSWIVVGLILFFLLRQLLNGLQTIDLARYQIDPILLIVSSLFFLAGMALFGWLWKAILLALDPSHPLSTFEAVRIYVTAQFGRYLPGSVWTYAVQMRLGALKGFSTHVLAIASWYEIVLSSVAVFLLPVFLLGPSVVARLPVSAALLGIVVFGGLVILQPRVLSYVYRLLPVSLRRVEFGPADFLPYPRVLVLLLGYMGIMIINGLGFVFFLQAFGIDALTSAPVLAGFFVLASGLGTVAIFAPGGLGVREGFLAVFLSTVLLLPAAIFISLASRVWLTIIELVAYGVVRLLGVYVKRT